MRNSWLPARVHFILQITQPLELLLMEAESWPRTRTQLLSFSSTCYWNKMAHHTWNIPKFYAGEEVPGRSTANPHSCFYSISAGDIPHSHSTWPNWSPNRHHACHHQVSPSLPSRFHFVRVIHFFPPNPPAILQAKTNTVFTDYVINFLCHPYVYHMP